MPTGKVCWASFMLWAQAGEKNGVVFGGDSLKVLIPLSVGAGEKNHRPALVMTPNLPMMLYFEELAALRSPAIRPRAIGVSRLPLLR